MNKKFLKEFKKLGEGGWYHSIDFGDGDVTKVKEKDPFRGIDRWNYFKEYLPNLQDKRIIDIGCNTGIFSFQAIRDGASYVLGLDSSKLAIQQALFATKVFSDNEKVEYSKKVDFKCLDVSKTSLIKFGKFDIAFLFSVIYCLKKRKAKEMLRELRQMVDVVAVQARDSHESGLNYPEDIKKALIETGFSDISLFEFYLPNGKMYTKPLIIAK